MVKVTILQTGTGKCALSSYEGEGLTAAFGDDKPLFWTWRSFRQLLALRLAQNGTQPQQVTSKTSSTSTGVSETK